MLPDMVELCRSPSTVSDEGIPKDLSQSLTVLDSIDRRPLPDATPLLKLELVIVVPHTSPLSLPKECGPTGDESSLGTSAAKWLGIEACDGKIALGETVVPRSLFSWSVAGYL